MIFNCTNCGISVSSKRENCPYCRISNVEVIEMILGRAHGDIRTKERLQLREKVKGTIFSYVLR
jgi:hypothetical protein